MKVSYIKAILSTLVIFISTSSLYAITAPMNCSYSSSLEKVSIECSNFSSGDSFYRAKYEDGAYTNFRENIPFEENCVLPGKYLYILNVECPGCDGSGGYSSCTNYLEVEVKEHEVECEDSGDQIDVDEEAFLDYKSEKEYHETCCVAEMSPDIADIDFGQISVDENSDKETVKIHSYRCTNAPLEAPTFTFKNGETAFTIELGKSNYTQIPHSKGTTEYLITFEPKEAKEYNETIIFSDSYGKTEIVLKGTGIASNDKTEEENDKNEENKDDNNQETSPSKNDSGGCSVIYL